MTEWIDLPPRTHTTREPVVTASLAIPAVGSPLLRFNVSRKIGDILGWQPKARIAAAHAPDGRRVRLIPATADGYTIGVRGTTLTFGFRLPWLDTVRIAHPAIRTPYTIEGAALIIDLPRWAVRPTSIATPISTAEAAVLAKSEALDLLAAGRSVREVADIVGEPTETVRAWKAEAPAERRAA